MHLITETIFFCIIQMIQLSHWEIGCSISINNIFFHCYKKHLKLRDDAKKKVSLIIQCSMDYLTIWLLGLLSWWPNGPIAAMDTHGCGNWVGKHGGVQGGAEQGDLSLSLLLDGWIRSSVTSKKSPNVYKSCSIMIPFEKEIFWHIHKNGLKCGQFGHNNCCHRL